MRKGKENNVTKRRHFPRRVVAESQIRRSLKAGKNFGKGKPLVLTGGNGSYFHLRMAEQQAHKLLPRIAAGPVDSYCYHNYTPELKHLPQPPKKKEAGGLLSLDFISWRTGSASWLPA